MAGTESSNGNEPRRPGWAADDVELALALERVTTPAGAKQRALERLRSEGLVEPGLSAEPHRVHLDQQPASESRLSSRRVSRRTVIALGACLAATAAGLVIYVRSLPLSQSELTAYCTSALETLSTDEPPQWQSAPRERVATRLATLNGKFSQPLTLVGSVDLEMPELAKDCTLYKFTARNGTLQLYVFDYTEPRKVAGLVGQLQTLAASSSSWSLAALQTPDQLLVVATEGDLQQFFRALQLA